MGPSANKQPEKSDKQVLRENVRVIDRSARKIEREITKLDALEKKQMKEVETLAKKGQH